ncbi:class I lanthipeptide [Chitinophaga nivalis]|uniref:Class I lanthipeptide n=1 Tax=Chitinophaga nivalis TaxID=2991709 RepID=A0ABT3II13_9BACT|nr:class I lanthipeptide [Chitinophaga nivalis]MCW3466717.1 class I lanthipeptide [Chitinophaga nivalis]MCW3483592.1 class I lanthipeptide [Chitinophaga nivalis]
MKKKTLLLTNKLSLHKQTVADLSNDEQMLLMAGNGAQQTSPHVISLPVCLPPTRNICSPLCVPTLRCPVTA